MEAMTDREQRVDQIRRAAIPVFASQGFKRTSMADLAEAAGVSRPALYQYFDNRADLFREALQIILVEATDAALAALRGDGLVADAVGFGAVRERSPRQLDQPRRVACGL